MMDKKFTSKFLILTLMILNFSNINVFANNVNKIKNFQLQNKNLKLINNNDQINNQLTQLENSILKTTYSFDPIEKRLDRLELEVFGDTNSDALFNDRIAKLINTTGFNYSNSNHNFNETNKLTNKDEFFNQNLEKEDSTVSYPMVDTLEKEVFNHSFTNDDIYNRLSRLEKEVYKKTSDHLSLSDRIDTLKGSILNQNPLYSYSDNNDEVYYSNDSNDIHIPSYWGQQQNPYHNEHIPNQSSIDPYLAQLEDKILKSNFSNESPHQRLSRLENKLFNKNFSSDSDIERLDRLMAVSDAKDNSSIFDNNKLMRGLSAGVQIGGIILMILAMIL